MAKKKHNKSGKRKRSHEKLDTNLHEINEEEEKIHITPVKQKKLRELKENHKLATTSSGSKYEYDKKQSKPDEIILNVKKFNSKSKNMSW